MLTRRANGRRRVVLLHALSVGLPDDWSEDLARKYHDAAYEALCAARELGSETVRAAASEIVAHVKGADPVLHLRRLTARLRAEKIRETPLGLYLDKADDHTKKGLGFASGGRSAFSRTDHARDRATADNDRALPERHESAIRKS